MIGVTGDIPFLVRAITDEPLQPESSVSVHDEDAESDRRSFDPEAGQLGGYCLGGLTIERRGCLSGNSYRESLDSARDFGGLGLDPPHPSQLVRSEPDLAPDLPLLDPLGNVGSP